MIGDCYSIREDIVSQNAVGEVQCVCGVFKQIDHQIRCLQIVTSATEVFTSGEIGCEIAELDEMFCFPKYRLVPAASILPAMPHP